MKDKPMKRRTFMVYSAATALLGSKIRAWGPSPFSPQPGQVPVSLDGLVGKPVNLAAFGLLQSWLNPEASPLLRKQLGGTAGSAPGLLQLPWKDSESDLGIEWPEFRTIDNIVVRFTGPGGVPEVGRTYIEYWSGITTRQGEWKALEQGKILATPVKRNQQNWEYPFPSVRTCKVRLRLQDQKRVGIASFEAYGPSRWKTGEVHIEWGHLDSKASYDGQLEMYNGYALEVKGFGDTRLKDQTSWISKAGDGRAGGIVARVIYTWGLEVDRTILTIRSNAGNFSFLPGEILEDQPIEIPDFGIYVRNRALTLSAADFRKNNTGKSRIMDAVERRPEQTLENAKNHIHATRVALSFIGVDSNNQKFGIAPDGHVVVGNNDPDSGKAMQPKFGVYFDSTQSPTIFENPDSSSGEILADWSPKQQELEEGWLPIIVTRWSNNELSFERTDYAVLPNMRDDLDESELRGDELALMISHLRIANNSAVPQSAGYFIKPWKPSHGGMPYGPVPATVANAWRTNVHEDCALVTEGDQEFAICYVDRHGRGSTSLLPEAGALRYGVVLKPGEKISVHAIIPGLPVPAPDAARLKGFDYDTLHRVTVKYWKDRLAEGMNAEIPDRHMQNLFNANLHHFLLVLTKDSERQEHYPNVAMLHYGSIGSESSPILQAMDMRGMHRRVRSCLQAWLSTQGDSKPEGDYASKEGGFYHFWPIYTIDQGGVLWALAEHYLYTRDETWLRKVGPHIVAGCDFIIRERHRTMKPLPGGEPPLYSGLAPAGCVADMRDWQYSFMLNAYFHLALKKSALVLHDVDPANAKRIASEADEYRNVIRRVLKECVAMSPVTRLLDNTGVPTVPSYLGLRGLSTDVKDSVDPDARHAYAYDATIGPFHLLKGEVLAPNEAEVTWMLNYFEDRLFLFSPLKSRVDLSEMATDWFNQGGYEKLQPYYVHYQDAYLDRDQIPHFLRGFFNTLMSIADSMTLTFQEELDFSGAQPHKTHEEAWFFHQFRFLLVKEMGNDLFLARGTPREWLGQGKRIALRKAPTYFGEVSYAVLSDVDHGRIEAEVNPPVRQRPAHLYLRLRHPEKAALKQVTVNGGAWTQFNAQKEWIELPTDEKAVRVVALY